MQPATDSSHSTMQSFLQCCLGTGCFDGKGIAYISLHFSVPLCSTRVNITSVNINIFTNSADNTLIEMRQKRYNIKIWKNSSVYFSNQDLHLMYKNPMSFEKKMTVCCIQAEENEGKRNNSPLSPRVCLVSHGCTQARLSASAAGCLLVQPED